MSTLKRLFFICVLAALWSPSFLFIKLAIESLSPFSIVAFRLGIAAILISAILVWRRQSLPKDVTFWRHIVISALVSNSIPFTLFCIAEQSINSGMAAILNGTAPMFTVFLAHLTIKNDSLTPPKLVGVFLSLGGLIWLFAPHLSWTFTKDMGGMFAATCAAICYAIGHVYSKKYLTGHRPFVVPAAQLIVASILQISFALSLDNFPSPSMTSMLGVLGLAFFGTFLAFIIYYYLLEYSGPTAISTSASLFPVGGLLLGFLFLNESLSLQSLCASSLIIIGTLFVNQIIKIPILTAKTYKNDVVA